MARPNSFRGYLHLHIQNIDKTSHGVHLKWHHVRLRKIVSEMIVASHENAMLDASGNIIVTASPLAPIYRSHTPVHCHDAGISFDIDFMRISVNLFGPPRSAMRRGDNSADAHSRCGIQYLCCRNQIIQTPRHEFFSVADLLGAFSAAAGSIKMMIRHR